MNIKSIVTLIMAILLLPCTALAVDVNSPLAHWTLDDGGGGIAVDSAAGNDGTLVNGPIWADGKINGALDFDGADDIIYLPDNNPVWLPENDFSVAMWVYCETAISPTTGVTETLFNGTYKRSSNPANEMGFRVFRGGTTGQFGFYMATTTNTDEDLLSNTLLETDRWYHLVAVRNGTTQSVYIDGQEDASRTCSPDPIKYTSSVSDIGVHIGAGTEGAPPRFHFQGTIDEVSLFDRALSLQEIQQLYTDGAGGLVAHWKLDDAAGSTAADSAGSNDGTLIDGPLWASGKIDGALDFDGVDDYVNIPNDILPSNIQYTMTGWISPRGENSDNSWDDQCIIDLRGQYQTCVYWQESDFSGNPSSIAFYNVNSSTVGVASSDNSAPVNTWTHFAASFDGTTMQLYINGQLAGFAASEPPVPISASYWSSKIGKDYQSPDRNSIYDRLWFNGKIDDVRVYNKDLSAEEIQQLYDEGALPELSDMEIAVEKIETAIAEKLRIINEIDGLIQLEIEANEALELVLDSGDYGDLKKKDINNAINKLDAGTRQQLRSISDLDSSIDKLIESLSWLDIEYLYPPENQLPEVTITDPQNGQSFHDHDDIAIRADASDPDGFVARVEFYAGDTFIAEDTTAADGFEVFWQDHPIGTYTLTATAVDDKDAYITSAPVEITITGGGGGK